MSKNKINEASRRLGLGDVQVSVLEFRPDDVTMRRFNAEPMALWSACGQWWQAVLQPPEGLTDPDPTFDQLTRALMLWAGTHGLGDGMALADAAAATYRREPLGDAVLRAQSFIELIRDRAAVRPATTGPAVAEPARAQRPEDKRGLTVREVAKNYLRVRSEKVYKWIGKGELSALTKVMHAAKEVSRHGKSFAAALGCPERCSTRGRSPR